MCHHVAMRPGVVMCPAMGSGLWTIHIRRLANARKDV